MLVCVMPPVVNAVGVAGALGKVLTVTEAVAESPLLLLPTTSRVYSVSAVKLVNVYVFTSPASVQLSPLALRTLWVVAPVDFVQLRVISVWLMSLVLKLVGALTKVVALIEATVESPLLLLARTSKVYAVLAVKPVNSYSSTSSSVVQLSPLSLRAL